MAERGVYRSSPRPDDFFDSPSTSEGETTSAALPSSPPIPAPAHRPRVTPQKNQNYLGSTAPQRVSQCDEEVKTAPEPLLVPGFLSLTSTPPAGDDSLSALKSRRNGSESSYDGSIEEMAMTGQARPVNIRASGSGKIVHNCSPRSSAVIDDRTRESKADPLLEDHILDVHTITLQALRGEVIGANTKRLSKENLLAEAQSRLRSASVPVPRRVHVVPPPIDTTQKHLPADIVRTPYPFGHHRIASRRPPLSPNPLSAPGPRESILTLSIRRRDAVLSPRISRLSIPANLQGADIKSTSASGKEKYFASLEFDDELFFRQLRKEYAVLSGPWRFFSARSLRRIAVGHSSTCLGCLHHRAQSSSSLVRDAHFSNQLNGTSTEDWKPTHAPRSPRFLTSLGLSDTFSEASLLQNFRKPKTAGKGRYAWVHWAHRLAATEGVVIMPIVASPRPLHLTMSGIQSPQSPSSKEDKGSEKGTNRPLTATTAPRDSALDEASFSYQCAAGLEFVEGWSWLRIGVALAVVLVLALAGAMLWIFLGLGGPPLSGFKNAGGRVGIGVLLGGFVLLVGWTMVLGWAGVSWLVT